MARTYKTKKNITRKKTVQNSNMDIPETKWDQENFLNFCGITSEQVENSKLEWNELAVIYDDQSARIDALDTSARYIVERLQKVHRVHSVRSRVKNPAGLVRKVIRKRVEEPKRDINFTNYRQQITDLVGIRALHLYKEDWHEIHEFILNEWETVENPTAYIREGDKADWTKSYEENHCTIKIHPRNYRSVHYLIKCSGSKVPTIAEIQVRTLFEEAWSEIDHQINYPVAASYDIVTYYLELFNRYAGSADEMGSFLPVLVAQLRAQDSEMIRANFERDEALKKLEELIKKSKMDENEKAELKTELRKATATQSNSSGYTEQAMRFNDILPLVNTTRLPSSVLASSARIDSVDASSILTNVFSLKKRCISCNCELDEFASPIVRASSKCLSCLARPYSIARF